MNRKIELYKMIIESKNVNDKKFFEELQGDIILKKFLDDYYKEIVYYEKNIEDINEIESNSNSDQVAVDTTANNLENSTDVIQGTLDTHNKKFDIKSKSICYYVKTIEEETDDVYEIDGVENEVVTRNIIMEYIKYDKAVKVVNKDTLKERFKKDKNEGDLEKQHYMIKTFNNINKALIVWERVLGAITIGLVEKNINSEFKEWIKENYADDKEKRNFLLGYHVRIYAIPSKDLIEELLTLDRISLLKITVKKEKLTKDEDISFSEENISRDEVELSYKPKQGLSFSKSKVKNYVEKFKNNKEIKRIVINGKRSGNLITLNTELMKMSEYIDIKVGEDGLLDSDDLFEKFKNFIQTDLDYLSEIFIEFEPEEE